MSHVNNLDKFLEKIARGQVCIGSGISFSDPSVSELVGDVGFDFGWIDMEHSPMSLEAALGHVLALRGTGAASFIRVQWNDPVLIKPVLELSPAAIIVPMVRSAEETARAVSACKYPPAGVRGFGPRRGMRFGKISAAEYVAEADKQTLVFLQIEHVDALNDLERILKTPGVDGLCVGPYDLSGSMGKLGQVTHPEVRAQITRILRTTRQFGKIAGIACGSDAETINMCLDGGAQWVNPTADWISMSIQSRAVLDQVRAVEMKRKKEAGK